MDTIINLIIRLMFFLSITFLIFPVNSKELKVNVVKVQQQVELDNLNFTGVIEHKNLVDIIAITSGIVDNLDLELGKTVKQGEHLFSIISMDPGFAQGSLHLATNGGKLVRRFIDNGHFVNKNDLLLQLASGEDYIVVIYVPNYEVEHFKSSTNINFKLYTPNKADIKIPVSNIRIQIPEAGKSLHRVEITIDCQHFHCLNTELAGALVKANVGVISKQFIEIPRKALINGKERVMVLTAQNKVEYRDVNVDSYDLEDKISISNGLTAGERVIFNYNFLPSEMEQANIVLQPINTGL
jgi:hypothetical protein